MQNTGQKRSRHAPPETSNPEDKAVKAWTQLTRRLLVVLTPLQYLFEHLLETIMGAQSQRRVLARLIENMSDEELHHVTKMAKDEMNRRGELSDTFIVISDPEQRSDGSQRKVQKETLVRTQRCDQIDSLPGIEMLTGPRPRCRCGLQVKIHLSTEVNHEEEIYFRCPKYPGQQCEFKQWTPCQPLKDVTSWKYRQQPGEKPKSYAEVLEGMVQEICPHSATHRKGSNAFLTKVTCRYCNKVIRQEKKAVVTETVSPSSPSETLPRPSTPTPTSPQEGVTEPEDYQDFMDFLRWRRMKGPSSQ